jgi:hypothetical protein
MISLRVTILFLLSLGLFSSNEASATPPATCAHKFIGKWQHDTSNIADLTADGRAICSGNPFCTQGTWTCSGDSLTYTTSAGTYVYTLQPSGVMTYGSIVVTRIGPPPASGASQSGKTGSPSRCKQDEAKANLDWVFADAGAKNSYAAARKRGLSPLDAAIQAQAHNARAQQTLRDCASWVEAQLSGRGEQRSNEDLPNRRLSQADCKCLSVLPAEKNGKGYNVVMDQRCDSMDVKVKLEGDQGPSIGAFPRSTLASVGILRAGATQFIRSPDWWIVSIKAVALRNASSSFVCNL